MAPFPLCCSLLICVSVLTCWDARMLFSQAEGTKVERGKGRTEQAEVETATTDNSLSKSAADKNGEQGSTRRATRCAQSLP